MTVRSGNRCLISTSNCSPSIPGMLMPERTAISGGSISPASRSNASVPEAYAKHTRPDGSHDETAAEKAQPVGFVVHDQDADAHNAVSAVGKYTRQADCEFGELAEGTVDLDRAAMLLCDDVPAEQWRFHKAHSAKNPSKNAPMRNGEARLLALASRHPS